MAGLFIFIITMFLMIVLAMAISLGLGDHYKMRDHYLEQYKRTTRLITKNTCRNIIIARHANIRACVLELKIISSTIFIIWIISIFIILF